MIPESFNQTETCQLLGESSNTVRTLTRNEGLPLKKEGRAGMLKISPKELIDWVKMYAVKMYRQQLMTDGALRGDSEDDLPLTRAEEELRLTRERADGEALKNAQRRWELGPVQEFQISHDRSIVVIKQSLLASRGRRSQELLEATTEHEVDKIWMDEVKTALRAASNALVREARSDGAPSGEGEPKDAETSEPTEHKEDEQPKMAIDPKKPGSGRHVGKKKVKEPKRRVRRANGSY